MWSGLTRINEIVSGSDDNVNYIDGIKYHQRRFLGHFSGNLEAYHYPDSLHQEAFTQRRTQSFGLSYRTGTANAYKIHIVYNVTLLAGSFSNQQIETDVFRWPFTSLPLEIPGVARSSHLVIDTSIAYQSAVDDLEDMLYGTVYTDPQLPTPEEILSIFENNAIVKVTDHGDGSFTITAPDHVLTMVDATTFEITWPSVVVFDSDNYQISSL